MNTQISLSPMVVFVTAGSQHERPVQACSRDYGFDVDEEEIGREMLAPVPASFLAHVISEPEGDGSENAELWFLS